MAAFLASAIAVNSASVLDSAMVGWIRVRYHMVPPASSKQILMWIDGVVCRLPMLRR